MCFDAIIDLSQSGGFSLRERTRGLKPALYGAEGSSS
jgi:hypothetical protein